MKYWFLFCLLFSGCSTTPVTGVRSDYQTTRVRKITVAPAFSLDTFGVDAHERRVIEQSVERDSLEWLRRAGFVADSPEALRANHADEWQDIHDAWYRGVELESLFERGAPEFEGAEIAAIQRIGRAPEAPTILLVQVLYQADANCEGDSSEFTAYAVTPSVKPPYACTVTHLEGKLLDARTGDVIWHNRAYVELAGPPTPTERRRSVRIAVEWLLGSSDGLFKLLTKSVESAP